MVAIPEIEILQTLHIGHKSAVYRGRRESDGKIIILKTPRGEFPAARRLARFHHEIDIITGLKGEGGPRIYAAGEYNQSLFMALEDIGGRSLDKQIQERRLELVEFLALAIRLVGALNKLHDRQIIHKDINPSNIIWNPETKRVVYIDFGISTKLTLEHPELLNARTLEGSLSYMSPEQTGRMNRAVDYRTDYYSLGITFYELLTGACPFRSDDPLELVHSHLAKTPRAPADEFAEIPRALSQIIMKLLKKRAEERYQSVAGLSADLKKVYEAIVGGVKIDMPVVGQNDISDKFQPPQTLIGRETDREKLISAFERAARGRAELALVSGYAGIGKSTLVHEIYPPITEKRAYFAYGKFEQLKRDIPYEPFVRAIGEIIRQILTCSAAEIADWNITLSAALGNNVGVITRVFPALELIVGRQAEAPALPANEALNRFVRAFRNLLEALASAEYPLVLFLDDLQWADLPSLGLLETFINDHSLKHILFIGACRPIALEETHPLRLMLKRSYNGPAIIEIIKLSALSEKHVGDLLVKTLRCTESEARPLATLIRKKTEGNPFFINQFLLNINRRKLLYFNYEINRWAWELEKIEAIEATGNVIDLLVENIKNLSEGSRNIMIYASCIGTNFDLDILSRAVYRTPRETARELGEVLATGLILPVNEAYKFVEYEEDYRASYRFLHDRVQQAAYSLLESEDRRGIHLAIGRLLLDKIPGEERDDNIFDIVAQFNQGAALIESEGEKYTLANLNLQAGKKAKTSAAYSPAYLYFQAGIKTLPDDAREKEYELTLNLYASAAEAAYLSGKLDESSELIRLALEITRTVLERVRVYEIKIRALTARQAYGEAQQTALSVLKLLGENFPAKPTRIHIVLPLLKSLFLSRKPERFNPANMPQMTDPYKLAAIGVIALAGSTAYFSSPVIFPLLVLRAFAILSKYGYTQGAPFILSGYSVMLIGVLGKIQSGYEIGNLGLELLEQHENYEYRTKAKHMINSLVRSWKEPLREIIPDMLETYNIGVENGDLEFASYSICQYFMVSYYAGVNLNAIHADLEHYKKIVKSLDQLTSYTRIRTLDRILEILGVGAKTEKTETDSWESDEGFFDVEKVAAEQGLSEARGTIHVLYLNLMSLYYTLGENRSAYKISRTLKELEDIIIAQVESPVYYFYDSMVLLANIKELTGRERWFARRRIKRNQKKLKRFSAQAPMNINHKYYLVEAERKKLAGNVLKAIELYSLAASLARKNKFIQEEALAHERLAILYLERGETVNFEAHLNRATGLYNSWGAKAKVRQMQGLYKGNFTNETDEDTSYPRRRNEEGVANVESGLRLDITTALKASRTISGTVVFSELLRKILMVLMENAGADRGVYLQEREGTWLIEARGALESGEVEVLKSVLIDEENMPLTILNYVTRTGENLVLGNATTHKRFRSDPYIDKERPLSVLCFPIEYQSKTIGVIYLENKLSADVFSVDRLEILSVLAAQAAVSLENARLYSNLEDEVKERTIDLNRAHAELEAKDKALQYELDLARNLQHGLVPALPVSYERLNVSGRYLPLGKVGGDVYDIILLPDGRYGILMADASGHGIHAAFITAIVKTGFAAACADTDKPERVLELLNRDLKRVVQTHDYITAILLIIEEGGGVSLSSAGHPAACVLRAGMKTIEEWSTEGTLLGIFSEPELHQARTRLMPGDRVLLYTDGLTDLHDERGETLGRERIDEILLRHAESSVERTVRAIHKLILELTEQNEPADDITFLLLEYR